MEKLCGVWEVDGEHNQEVVTGWRGERRETGVGLVEASGWPGQLAQALSSQGRAR